MLKQSMLNQLSQQAKVEMSTIVDNLVLPDVGDLISPISKKWATKKWAQPTFVFMGLEKAKTHDYTDGEVGVDYAIDAIDESRVYMTAQRRKVSLGDYILLKNGAVSERYQVQEIDYYTSPADMWVAQLVKVIE